MIIRYKEILEYVRDYHNIPYSSPNKETDPVKKQKLSELRDKSRNATEQLKEIGKECEERFNLKKDGLVKWLDGSNVKTRGSLWLQLKKDEYKSHPISISIQPQSTDDIPRFCINLELYEDIKPEDLEVYKKIYNSHLDLSKDNDMEYSYWHKGTDKVDILNEDMDKIKERASKGQRIQPCIYIYYDPSMSDKDYDVKIMDAVAKLIPYYEHVMEYASKIENGGANMNSQSIDINYKNPYSKKLIESKNIIFRGAPGTGKTYLAKKIATDIVSNGQNQDFDKLSDEQKEQIGFVQFHPSYDYTDFVEGLRPYTSENDAVGFKLQDGVFKSFVNKARANFENHHKKEADLRKEASAKNAIDNFLSADGLENKEFKTLTGNIFFISEYDEKTIKINIPGNAVSKRISLKISIFEKLLQYDKVFDNVSDLKVFLQLPRNYAGQEYSYYYALHKEIFKNKKDMTEVHFEELKNYVFIIDEINRGEISKIFGELFFSIDPGYRGEGGKVSTQYQNLHDDQDDKFYIPENVYIIGTMNDIDRSVDTFDFAMRRRFRFIEIKPDENQGMLDVLKDDKKGDAINRMNSLNKEIVNTEGLNENYQIGASYFLKLKDIGFDELWSDYLKPLLEEYVRGLSNEKELIEKFEKAYNLKNNESSQNQG